MIVKIKSRITSTRSRCAPQLTCSIYICAFAFIVSVAEARIAEPNASQDYEPFLSNGDLERPLEDHVFLTETDFEAGERISKESPVQSSFLS
ncbi:hypothetical protein PMAYCL1PPCAC_20378, partial [Pristionchus mayeri]